MKLTIEKLGRIQSAQLDVRPLTVLIGPNKTNKTWTAYALYGCLQSLCRKPSALPVKFVSNGEQGPSSRRKARLREALRPLFHALEDPAAPTRVELSLDAASLFLEEDQALSAEERGVSLGPLLGVAPERVAAAASQLEFLRTEFATSIASMDFTFERALQRLQIRTHRCWRAQDGQVHRSSTLSSLIKEAWTEQKIFDALEAQTSSFIENVVVFPAERGGLLPIGALVPEWERLGVPLPIKDFGRFLAVAQTMALADSMTAVQQQLSRLLHQVMGGALAYVADLEGKRLVFRTGPVEVPIHAAASLARAVAGLALYVERFFQPDDVLIIDELEMNAHPQAQLALTEFIAALVNAGVRVVFTTHSPYVVDHLNNLMEAARVPEARREDLARRFSLKTPSSFISSGKVSVYAFQEQTPGGAVVVQDALNRETNLIDWSTFSRVSEHTTNLYSDILRAAEDES